MISQITEPEKASYWFVLSRIGAGRAIIMVPTEYTLHMPDETLVWRCKDIS